MNGERGRHTALTEKKTKNQNQKNTPEVSPGTETVKSPAPSTEKQVKKEVKVQQEVQPLKQEVKEPRQEPEGQITVTLIREKPQVPVVGTPNTSVLLV